LFFSKALLDRASKITPTDKLSVCGKPAFRANQGNTSEISEKWENESVFRVFDIAAHFLSICFDCQQIELENLPILVKFESAASLPSRLNRAKPI
jgi:hypothetical protein